MMEPMKFMTDGCGVTFALFIALPYQKNCQSLVAGFSKLDRWHKKKRGSSFLEKEAEFYHMLTSCLMFFSTTLHSEDVWREHKLRMTEEDYSFYHDQKGPRVAKCLDVLLPLTSSDKQFMRRSEIKSNLSSSSACHSEMETESAADYVSESESTHRGS